METMEERGREWLIQCAPDSAEARAQWQADPSTALVMATGHYFDAMVVSEQLGLEACDLIRRHQLTVGPVLIDTHAHKVGFIAPPRSWTAFANTVDAAETLLSGLRYLSNGDFMVVPGPAPLPNSRHQWLYSPTDRPDPSKVRTATLAVLLCTASQTLARMQSRDVYSRIPTAPFSIPFAHTPARVTEPHATTADNPEVSD